MFNNGIRTDWRIENLKWVCYNCAFVLGLDYFSNRMIRDIESHTSNTEDHKQELQSFYQFDDFYLQHLDKLGLNDSGDVFHRKPEDLLDLKKDDSEDLIDLV